METMSHQIRQAEVFACRAGLTGGILTFLLLAALITTAHHEALWEVPALLVMAAGVGYGIGHYVHAYMVRGIA